MIATVEEAEMGKPVKAAYMGVTSLGAGPCIQGPTRFQPLCVYIFYRVQRGL